MMPKLSKHDRCPLGHALTLRRDGATYCRVCHGHRVADGHHQPARPIHTNALDGALPDPRGMGARPSATVRAHSGGNLVQTHPLVADPEAPPEPLVLMGPWSAPGKAGVGRRG